jgi:hypothetical protein
MGIKIGSNTLSGINFNTLGENIVPNVVTDGLVLWLDAGNGASFGNADTYYDCGYGCQYYSTNPGCTNCNTQWKDMSGYGNDATLYNGAYVSYDTNSGGGSVYFDGVNDNARQSNTTFNRVNGDEMTVSVWMRPGRNGGQYQDIIVNRSDSLYNWMLYQHTTDGSIQLHGSAQNKSSYIPTLNVWINVSATVTSGGVYTLYVNGVVQQTVSGYTYAGMSPSLLCIGCFGTTIYEPYLGYVSSAMIYNRSLSANEILQNFNNGRIRFGI